MVVLQGQGGRGHGGVVVASLTLLAWRASVGTGRSWGGNPGVSGEWSGGQEACPMG